MAESLHDGTESELAPNPRNDDGRWRWLPVRVLAYGALFVGLVVLLAPDRPDDYGDADAAGAYDLELGAALFGAASLTMLLALLIEAAIRTFRR